MTTEQIFSKVSAHLVKGMMIHDGLADYYDFLSLRGYKRCHEYHFKKESCMYRKLHRWYINRYNRLIEEVQIDNPNVIPSMWYKYQRQGVDPQTKAEAVKDGMEMWVRWERDTLATLQQMDVELRNMGNVPASCFIEKMIKEVAEELKGAERKHIDLMAVDYDIVHIVEEQKRLHDKYKAML